jgi:hypothetical protein
MPAGLTLDIDFINQELKRRQGGYGRGGRQAIEDDSVEFLAGVRHGVTTGAPIVENLKSKCLVLFAVCSTLPHLASQRKKIGKPFAMLVMILQSIVQTMQLVKRSLNTFALPRPTRTPLEEHVKHMFLDVQSVSAHAHHGNQN